MLLENAIKGKYRGLNILKIREGYQYCTQHQNHPLLGQFPNFGFVLCLEIKIKKFVELFYRICLNVYTYKEVIQQEVFLPECEAASFCGGDYCYPHKHLSI